MEDSNCRTVKPEEVRVCGVITTGAAFVTVSAKATREEADRVGIQLDDVRGTACFVGCCYDVFYGKKYFSKSQSAPWTPSPNCNAVATKRLDGSTGSCGHRVSGSGAQLMAGATSLHFWHKSGLCLDCWKIADAWSHSQESVCNFEISYECINYV